MFKRIFNWYSITKECYINLYEKYSHKNRRLAYKKIMYFFVINLINSIALGSAIPTIRSTTTKITPILLNSLKSTTPSIPSQLFPASPQSLNSIPQQQNSIAQSDSQQSQSQKINPVQNLQKQYVAPQSNVDSYVHTSYTPPSGYWENLKSFVRPKSIFENSSDIPNVQEKTAFLEEKLSGITSSDVSIPYIIHLTSGASYKDITTIINEARYIASKDDNNKINIKNFKDAIFNVKAGFKYTDIFKPINATKPERWGFNKMINGQSQTIYKTYEGGFSKSIAIHEASHAVINIILPQLSIVSSATIEERPSAAGFIQPTRSYLKIQPTRQQQLNNINMDLAGNIGQSYFENVNNASYSQKKLMSDNELWAELSSDRSSDMKHALATAREIASQYKSLTKAEIEAKIKKIIISCYKTTYQAIEQHKDKIEKLAHALLEKGTIDENEIYQIIDVAKPLYAFEHGPLLEVHAKDYKYRGYNNNLLSSSEAHEDFTQIRNEQSLQQPDKISLGGSKADLEALKSHVNKPAAPDVPIAIEYGYNNQGEYVGQDGIRNKAGYLEEI